MVCHCILNVLVYRDSWLFFLVLSALIINTLWQLPFEAAVYKLPAIIFLGLIFLLVQYVCVLSGKLIASTWHVFVLTDEEMGRRQSSVTLFLITSLQEAESGAKRSSGETGGGNRGRDICRFSTSSQGDWWRFVRASEAAQTVPGREGERKRWTEVFQLTIHPYEKKNM